MSLPKLESPRNVTSKVISNGIKARKSKSTEQYDCKLFFRLDGTCNSRVELSNSTGWDFDSTIKFNAWTSEKYCLWMICLWWLWYRSRFQHKASQSRLAHSQFPLFSSRDQQAAVGSLFRMEVILPNTSLLLNTLWQKKKMISWSRTWSISWHLRSWIGKIAYIIGQPNT